MAGDAGGAHDRLDHAGCKQRTVDFAFSELKVNGW